jgi:hypothetical protein
MDSSTSRRGQPCWYRVSNVKGLGKVHNIAINDSCMLEGAIYHILKNHFRRESYYVDILELFQEVRTTPFHRIPQSLSYPSFSGNLQDRDGPAC